MTATPSSPSSQAEVEKLLPCTGADCLCEPDAPGISHHSFCPAHCRPAVASALQALMDEKAELDGLLDDMKAHLDAAVETATAQDTRIVALEEEIGRLREALEPFAAAADIKLCGEWRDDQRFGQTDACSGLTFGHLRKARATLFHPDNSALMDGGTV